MVKLDEHPTVKRFRAAAADGEQDPHPAGALAADWLRLLCREAGADDAGFVAIDRPEMLIWLKFITGYPVHSRTRGS